MNMNMQFSFDYRLLESCTIEAETTKTSKQSLLTGQKVKERQSSSSSSSSACQDLYQEYSRHYRRQELSEDRFQKFQEMVKLIYNHNNNINNINNNDNNTYYYHHHLTLNQFSDDLNMNMNTRVRNVPNDVPISKNTTTRQEDDNTSDMHDSDDDDDDDDDDDFAMWRYQLRRQNHREAPDYYFTTPILQSMFDDHKLEEVQNNIRRHRGLKKGGHHHHHKKKQQHQRQDVVTTKQKIRTTTTTTTTKESEQPPPTLSWHHYVSNQPFNVVSLPKKGIGVEIDLKPTNHQFFSTDDSTTTGEDDNNNNVDKFAKSLNWATKDNPDKVPLVHEVFDQGRCGSCWAYAATGSVEASAARRAAHDAYINTVSQQQNNLHLHNARRAARQVEAETFQASRLSIQELIDCDTAADQGCVGGNPLLAFFYIRKYGLVPWDEYEYTAEEDSCRLEKISRPVVTVQSWGTLPKNHEDMIQLALRYIGPVAVAINAGDPTFIAYGGGIYDNPVCGQEANHALLIVGYGEEEVNKDGVSQIVRYWIARNSWGSGWGEDGYVRVKRGPGGAKIKGVCGIARSPSVALGGEFHQDRTILMKEDPTAQENLDYSSPVKVRSKESAFCDLLWNNASLVHVECIEISVAFDQHRAASLGVLSIILAFAFAVVPLSLQCCLRRRRRRRRLSSLSASMSSSSSYMSVGARSVDTMSKNGKEKKVSYDGANNAVGADERTPVLLSHNDNYGSLS